MIPLHQCVCIKFDSSHSYLSHASSYLMQTNFPCLHFCYCSAERRLTERYKGKRKEIIV